MFSYIAVEGSRIVTAWQTEWDSYAVDLSLPDRQVVLITDEEYEKIHKHLENYTYSGKDVKEKITDEKKAIKDQQKEWQKNNTLAGLQAQVAELKSQIPKK